MAHYPLTFTPELKILLSSRRPIQLLAEKEYRVLPLVLPPDISSQEMSPQLLNDLQEVDAVQLFLSLAKLRKSTFELTEQNATEVVELCRSLDGFPLALVLAASFLKYESIEELSRQAQSGEIQTLSYPFSDKTGRHISIDACIAWSYHYLSENEKKLFRRLSVFRGGCSLEALAKICNLNGDLPDNIKPTIYSLWDNSLILYDPNDPTKRRVAIMHKTLQDYAIRMLTDEHEDRAMKEQHLLYYWGLVLQYWDLVFQHLMHLDKEKNTLDKYSNTLGEQIGDDLGNLDVAVDYFIQSFTDPDLIKLNRMKIPGITMRTIKHIYREHPEQLVFLTENIPNFDIKTLTFQQCLQAFSKWLKMNREQFLVTLNGENTLLKSFKKWFRINLQYFGGYT